MPLPHHNITFFIYIHLSICGVDTHIVHVRTHARTHAHTHTHTHTHTHIIAGLCEIAEILVKLSVLRNTFSALRNKIMAVPTLPYILEYWVPRQKT